MNRPLFLPCTDGARLGLGGAALGNLYAPVAEADAQAVVRAAWNDGCRTFDTAPHYGNGLSEHRMGAALRAQPRAQWRLSSKVGRLLLPDAQAPAEQNGYVQVLPYTQRWDFSAAGIRRSVEDSLQRLGLAQLDAAFIHDIDQATHGDRTPEVWRQVLDETLPELLRLREQGLIRGIGLGVNDHAVVLHILRHADLDCLLLAGRYTLLDQCALPELLPLCQQRQVALALGGIFNSGILATGATTSDATFNYAPAPEPWREKTRRLQAVCAMHDVPLRAAALQFALAHPAVDLVLLGARHVSEWYDARAMLLTPIDPVFWDTLRRQGLLPEEAPTP